jgi:hypothetical protein
MFLHSATRNVITAFAKAAVVPFYRRKWRRFEALLAQARTVQHAALFDKLRRCADTRFGREHGFGTIRTVEDYRRLVPIAEYDYIAPYMKDVTDGRFDALFPPGEEILAFGCTTGTTGEPKLNPVTRTWLREYRRAWEVWGVKAITDHAVMIGTKMMQLTGPGDLGRTASGHSIGMVSSIAARYQSRIIRSFYATPHDIADITDSTAKYYTFLRMSIASPVGLLLAITPANLIRLAETGNDHCESLIRDVRNGTLRSDLDIPDWFRKKYARRLQVKHPERARALEAIVSRTGSLYPKNYWPLSLIACWIGGTIGYQTGELPRYYGSTPARDMGLVSTEGRHTIPIEDGKPEGVLAVDGNYYEFVPIDERGKPGASVFEGHELEVGRDYFIVMTTSSGLYRYDIGDVVRCRSFLGEAPVLEFLRKDDQCADMEGEKVSGCQVAQAAQTAFRELNLRAEYVTAVPVRGSGITPHYAVLVEHSVIADDAAARRFLEIVDRELIRQNVMYSGKRNDLYIGPPQLVRLAPGAWSKYITAQTSKNGTGESQYKHPALVPETNWLNHFQPIDTVTVEQPVHQAAKQSRAGDSGRHATGIDQVSVDTASHS